MLNELSAGYACFARETGGEGGGRFLPWSTGSTECTVAAGTAIKRLKDEGRGRRELIPQFCRSTPRGQTGFIVQPPSSRSFEVAFAVFAGRMTPPPTPPTPRFFTVTLVFN